MGWKGERAGASRPFAHFLASAAVSDRSFSFADTFAGAAGRNQQGKAREQRENGLQHLYLLNGGYSPLLHLRNHSTAPC